MVAVIKKAGVCFMFLPKHDLIDMQAGLPSSTYWLSLYMYMYALPQSSSIFFPNFNIDIFMQDVKHKL